MKEVGELPDADVVEQIMEKKWEFSQTYSIASAANVEAGVHIFHFVPGGGVRQKYEFLWLGKKI